MSTPPDYPEEYLAGKTTFFGRDFVVTPDVLIPRLETESLVRRARKILNSPPLRGSQRGYPTPPPLKGEERTIVVDIGCGSGIIGTSVADLADEVIFLDISPEALQVAQQNFRIHFPDKKAQFIVSDLLSALPTSYLIPPTSSILFLTNLPYIKDEDWKNMSADTVHEPKLALFGGEKTGFEMYERLFGQLHSMHYALCTMHCIYEFGFDQREVAELVVNKYPHWKYLFFADYAGVERFGEIILMPEHVI